MRTILKLIFLFALFSGCSKESYVDDLNYDSTKPSSDPRDAYIGVYSVSGEYTEGYITVVKGDESNTMVLSRLCIDYDPYHFKKGSPSKMTMNFATKYFSLDDVLLDDTWGWSNSGEGTFDGKNIAYSFSYGYSQNNQFYGSKIESFSK